MNDLRFLFASLSSDDVNQLGTLGSLDVDGDVLIFEYDVETINPTDGIWLNSLAAAHEIHSEATVETTAA